MTKNGLYNNVKRKKLWTKRGDAPLTTTKAGLHPKKLMLCIWWDFKGIVYYELLLENETFDSVKYCSQLTNLKQALDRKRSELVNRKGIVSIMIMLDHTHLWRPGKNFYNMAGMFWSIHRIHPTLRPQIFIYSDLYRIV